MILSKNLNIRMICIVYCLLSTSIISSDETDVQDEGSREDPVFEQIQRKISSSSFQSSADVHISDDSDHRIADNFVYWAPGFQPKFAYEHNKKHTDIMALTYNPRMRQFVLIDAKGKWLLQYIYVFRIRVV